MPLFTAVVLDTETTGLPQRDAGRAWGTPSFTSATAYEQCRIVSMSWLVYTYDTEQPSVEYPTTQEYMVVKPEGFYVPAASTAIHGITHEEAKSTGVAFADMIAAFMRSAASAHALVAHNMDFDINVLCHELYCRGMTAELNLIQSKSLVCTMKWGREVLALPKSPKLAEIYEMMYGVPIENAHHAKHDTWHCFKVYEALLRKTAAAPKLPEALPLKLSREQHGIVYENLDVNLLVLACAGAGKTTTILCRIWWLLRQGVAPRGITLTTFTRAAAEDMRHKLTSIVGYMPPIEIGTIDSICLKHLREHGSAGAEHSVNEYGIMFLDLLRNNPDARARILAGTRYLFVDEYQDISDTQNAIIQNYKDAGVKIIAIGDDAQNIYSWRGSKMEYILGFAAANAPVAVHHLTTNYRSTPGIIALANASIERNEFQYPKTMAPVAARKRGGVPDMRFFSSAFLQNEHVAEAILGYLEKGVPAREIAVLCHQNKLLYPLEEMMTRMRIPSQFAEAKDGVFLGTIHKAKGLEWRIVFMVHLNDEVFPSKRDLQGDVEEARRVFYVGVTRAREVLHMSFARIFGSSFVSRFVSELPAEVYHFPQRAPELMGLSVSSYTPVRMGVTDLIDTLEGRHLQALRASGGLPHLEWRRVLLHPEHEHPAYVAEHNLHADMGIFVDTLLCRILGAAYPESHGLTVGSAGVALSSVRLDKEQMAIYTKFKHLFYSNTRCIEARDSDAVAAAKLLAEAEAELTPTEAEVLPYILHKMRETSASRGIPLDKVAVMNERFLPVAFDAVMTEHWARFQDRRVSTEDALLSIWEVSKCERVVKERRRRLLFRKTPTHVIEAYSTLVEDLEQHTVPWMAQRFSSTSVRCHETFRAEGGVTGEVDLRWGNAIVDIKCSASGGGGHVTPEWTLQLLMYAGMVRKHGVPVDTIAVLNPLKGIWYETSIAHVPDAVLEKLMGDVVAVAAAAPAAT